MAAVHAPVLQPRILTGYAYDNLTARPYACGTLWVDSRYRYVKWQNNVGRCRRCDRGCRRPATPPPQTATTLPAQTAITMLSSIDNADYPSISASPPNDTFA